MPQYISPDGIEQSLVVVRLFKSYPEAALHGYHSLKRLKELGLSVPDSMRPYYRFMVETRYGRYPVYSKEQCGNATRRGLKVQKAEADSESPQTASGETDQDSISSRILQLPLSPLLHLTDKTSLVMLIPTTYGENSPLSDPRAKTPPARRISRPISRRRIGRSSGEWRSRRQSYSTNSSSSGTCMGRRRTSSFPFRGHTAGSWSGTGSSTS